MTRDYRVTFGLIDNTLDALERHGHLRVAACQRDHAVACVGCCSNQSCLTWQVRHQDAQDYDQIVAQVLQAAKAWAAYRDQPEPGSLAPSPGQSGHEVGQ